ncbi:hypothetical protein KKJ04_11680 [Xenorhabdus bovienii]|uniref:hypothetical protein n=1 Tax=Xenorhabdus bovienii TaxID=40576 RepID=UPI0023B34AF9|nr:hypothetical protein [Xenorhabdus bovienii]MDE9446253.1 hypothetical protein [Xenorhabdus bovienii]
MVFASRDVGLSCLGLLCVNLSDHQLLAVYSGAFSVLTYILMGITLLAVHIQDLKQ